MNKKPEWTPANAGKEYATSVVKGKESQHDGMPGSRQNKIRKAAARRKLSIDDYVQGVLNHDRTILAQTITLIESNSEKHFEKGQEVLRQLLPYTGKSLRIGITGVPGAGKSSFIEALGCQLMSENYNLAVLAVDPSSSLSKGSVLGDKTRMEMLSRHQNCFIRPSPSGGKLGGVTRKTRETTLICEAAGFDVIFIETVGVGQNEITVRSMVDFFLLLKIAGAGDELQGIKKGVIELADAILINKADGDNLKRAEIARRDFANALHYLKSPTNGWTPEVLTCSAVTGDGIYSGWEMIKRFESIVRGSGFFEQRRNQQNLRWVHDLVSERLLNEFYANPRIKALLPQLEKDVINGKIPPTQAAWQLLHGLE
ncbi:MAG: methylmalonyl Co-A mutase-associated GTPase MeaB [Candidatus Cloacimonetes bacterium]|nr:methylmalonyl Co-A mutase-associated GTPase MeaB [Candidatus Cloacimonadota bacterium]